MKVNKSPKRTLLTFLLIILVVYTLISIYFLIQQSDLINEQKMKLRKYKEESEEIQKTWLGKEKPTVILYGSSVTLGAGASSLDKSWANRLKTFFLETNPDVNFINLGVGGHTTKDILNSSLQITTNFQPDVIIFETGLINDFYELNTTESKVYLETIMNRLIQRFPDLRIYLMPPNIIAGNNRNSEGLLYKEYVANIEEFIKSKGWNYIDYWTSFEAMYKAQGLTLEQTLSPDRIHPNDKGYEIWFEVIKDNFSK